MMKKFLLVSAIVCALVGTTASPAAARTSVFVTGAGASAVSGQVVVHAIATGPLVDGPFGAVAPAVGFVRTPGSSFDDLSGTVTCIGIAQGGRAAIVSGNLATPFVSGGFTYPNFSLIVSAGATVPWIEIFPDNLDGDGLGPCGTSLFFSFFIPLLPEDELVRGHFAIGNGTSVVIINRSLIRG
jgi:hypothetical protein